MNQIANPQPKPVPLSGKKAKTGSCLLMALVATIILAASCWLALRIFWPPSVLDQVKFGTSDPPVYFTDKEGYIKTENDFNRYMQGYQCPDIQKMERAIWFTRFRVFASHHDPAELLLVETGLEDRKRGAPPRYWPLRD